MTDNETQPFDQDLYDRAKAEHAKNFEHDPGPWGSTDHYKIGFVAGVNAAARLAAARQPAPVVGEGGVRWWGWNFAQGKWFPCLGPEFRECVTSEGVIVRADLDHRDQVRDDLIRAVREALAAQAVQVPDLEYRVASALDDARCVLTRAYAANDPEMREVAKVAIRAIEQAKGGAE